MKQKVERETMNERVLTCTSDVCVYSISICMCVYTCNNTYVYSGWHTFVSSLSLEVARRFISCAANESKGVLSNVQVKLIVHISLTLCGSLPKIGRGSRRQRILRTSTLSCILLYKALRFTLHRVSHALVSVYIRVLSRRQFDQAVGTDDFPFGAIDAFPESIESKFALIKIVSNWIVFRFE